MLFDQANKPLQTKKSDAQVVYDHEVVATRNRAACRLSVRVRIASAQAAFCFAGGNNVSRTSLSPWWRKIAPYVGVVVGIVVLASPVIADLIESWQAEQTISQVTTVVQHVDAATKAELLLQARAYNEELATHVSRTDVWPYERQLVTDGTEAICWVEIPRIDVRLEVYHGTEKPALASGAGHVEGTSLPVGGTSTHCAISAHSGIPTARLFDNIRDLVPGDVFVLWTLEEPYAYRVTGSEVVEPDAVRELAIEPGRDLCTLVTCTPYGVNTHRLLVHGERCPYEEAQSEEAPPVYLSPNAWPIVAGLVVVGGALALASWGVIRSRRKGANSGEARS